MEVVEPVDKMRDICVRLLRDGTQIRFVPTMGSLHGGHAALIERAAAHQCGAQERDKPNKSNEPIEPNSGFAKARKPFAVIVSIFVNPIQFNNRHDFLNYPKTLAKDIELCKRTRCVDFVFVPKCHEMFERAGASNNNLQAMSQLCRIVPPTSTIALELEGASRPGHFEGMLTIVCKLFNIIQPDWAYFGEKDFQQLLLVKRLVNDLSMKTRICQVATIRESDTKLPMSSRNARLSLEQRQAGSVMVDILESAKEALEQKCSQQQSSLTRNVHAKQGPTSRGAADLDTILLSSRLVAQCLSDTTSELEEEAQQAQQNQEANLKIDYFELRCAQDLTVISFNTNLQLYDCQKGCVERGQRNWHSDDLNSQTDTLEARLLISVIVAKIRLLDNLVVRLNL